MVFTCNKILVFFSPLPILQLFHFCNNAPSGSHVDFMFGEMGRKIVTTQLYLFSSNYSNPSHSNNLLFLSFNFYQITLTLKVPSW